MPIPISPRRELVRLIRYMSPEKLKVIIKVVKEFDDDELTDEDIAAIKLGEESIARGETMSLEEFCHRERI